MHPNSIYPLVLPPKKTKHSKQANKNEGGENQQQTSLLLCLSFLPLQHFFIRPGGIGGLGVSHSKPFCPISFTYRCSLQ